MQGNDKLSYINSIKNIWNNHGIKLFWKGAEARVGLLVIVNILNETGNEYTFLHFLLFNDVVYI